MPGIRRGCKRPQTSRVLSKHGCRLKKPTNALRATTVIEPRPTRCGLQSRRGGARKDPLAHSLMLANFLAKPSSSSQWYRDGENTPSARRAESRGDFPLPTTCPTWHCGARGHMLQCHQGTVALGSESVAIRTACPTQSNSPFGQSELNGEHARSTS